MRIKPKALSYGLIGGLILFALVSWQWLPPMMITHWDSQGNPNGFLPKHLALLLFPVLGILLFLLFVQLPQLDPLKKRQKIYDWYLVSVLSFLFVLLLFIILLNRGIALPWPHALFWLLAGLFLSLGFFLPKTKQNWFVGIRTPWTLANEHVWRKTHQEGKKVFLLLAFLTFFTPRFLPLWLWIWFLLLSVGYLVLFSFFSYKKLQQKKQ